MLPVMRTAAQLRQRQTQTQRRVAISAEISSIGDVEEAVHPKSDDDKERIREALQKHPLFEALQPELIADIVDAMEECKVASDKAVITQGAPSAPPPASGLPATHAVGPALCPRC